MEFKEYQEETAKYAVYPKVGSKFVYPILGLVGETGEVTEKLKKAFREKDGIICEDLKKEIQKELGDVLWYFSQLATELEISLEDVAQGNIEKVKSRRERGKQFGNGYNR